MRHLLILLVILAISTVSTAQTSTKKVDNKYKLENGNVIVPKVSPKNPTNWDSTTVYTYLYNNDLIHVYISPRGSYYVWMTSKKGNLYKKYIKFDK